MPPTAEIVITGTGLITPIGIGKESFWRSLCEGRSGVRRLNMLGDGQTDTPLGAAIADFDPKQYVRPRKSLKVMSRDIQLGFVAADLACSEAALQEKPVDPQRTGVVFGADMIACELNELAGAYRTCMADGKLDFTRWGPKALPEMYPLWMLKYLPNMTACHIGIARDARGPNNSLVLGEVSSLSAIAEAARVIQRGQADLMIAGGVSSRINPTDWIRSQVLQLSGRVDDPAAACRPFDADRDGMVNGEGAAAFTLESREDAEARGARILARILGFASAFEPSSRKRPLQGNAIRTAIIQALRSAGLQASDVGHVNAHGLSTTADDRIEAQAIRQTLGDVPVTAPKSYFGNLGAGAGAVEMAVSTLAFENGMLPPTLNYQRPDPQCPVNVIHGQPMKLTSPVALVLNHAQPGQAIAMLLASP